MSRGHRSADGRVAFLRGLIDDAALFPPAREPMDVAVAAHVRNRGGPFGWVQGRFLCPASRLREFTATLLAHADDWRVGLIVDGPATAGTWEAGVESDLIAAAHLPDWSDGRARVEAVEVRLPDDDPEAVGAHAGRLAGFAEAARFDRPVQPYLEFPRSERWLDVAPALIAAIAAVRAAATPGVLTPPGAKLRCGGVTADAFPSSTEVAAFVAACAEHGVPFKATAGLHHPLPRIDPATGARMHGFLNVLGGALLLGAGAIGTHDLAAVLNGDDVHLGREALRWRDAGVDAATIARLRRDLVVGYGSCSFTEPIEDLTELGVLPL